MVSENPIHSDGTDTTIRSSGLDRITVHSGLGTGRAIMHSKSLDRYFDFEFTFTPGAPDMDIAHAASMQLLRCEIDETDRLRAEKEGDRAG
jgi:hypothetical protein